MRSVVAGRTTAILLVLCGALVWSGCYHSIITTNNPVGEMHHEAFKPAFIAGLVPAQVDASGYCGGRPWAKVETQQTFLNWVVAAVTFGIFTPLDIRVYCAGPGVSAELPGGVPAITVGKDDPAERAEALAWATKFASESGEAVYIAF
jgi:hypothetical protein